MNVKSPQQQTDTETNESLIKLPYEQPALAIKPLAMVTRGGTPGTGDSGEPTDIPG